MDKGRATILTLFNFSEAFGSLYHYLLLFKFERYCFTGGCVNWVKFYLTDRRQCEVRYNVSG